LPGRLLEQLYQHFFCDGFFPDRVLGTICLGWLQTAILLISASCVARITGMSHSCLAQAAVLRRKGVAVFYGLAEMG
jgi:hypothetical protein